MQLLSTLTTFVTLALFVSAASLEKRAVTNLPANGKFDYQIGGAYTPDSDVKVRLFLLEVYPIYINDYSGCEPRPKCFSCVRSL
jgi:hypothetical protein